MTEHEEIVVCATLIVHLLIQILRWNCSYREYVIRGKHKSGKDITKVVHDVSEKEAVSSFRGLHKGIEVYSIEDTSCNGWRGY